jgi:hypothetical protein
MSRSSQVVRDLILLIGLPFTLMVGLLIWWSRRDAGQPPTRGDIFAAVEGRWRSGGAPAACAAAWHAITFDSARTRMAVTPVAGDRDEYLIQGHEPDRIISLLVGDSTLGDDGAQAVWLLITTSDTSYVWRRRDWFAGHVSEPSFRCPSHGTDP